MFSITCYFVLGNSDQKNRSDSNRQNDKHIVNQDLESFGGNHVSFEESKNVEKNKDSSFT